ncbi:unnamed protein product [Rotaria sp. Silwood2]|nr:unnamed protein product [Rotaria sp. Silwood2]
MEIPKSHGNPGNPMEIPEIPWKSQNPMEIPKSHGNPGNPGNPKSAVSPLTYIFKIQAITVASLSPMSDISNSIKTAIPSIETAVMHLLENAAVIKVGANSTLTIYKLEYIQKVISRMSRLRKAE